MKKILRRKIEVLILYFKEKKKSVKVLASCEIFCILKICIDAIGAFKNRICSEANLQYYYYTFITAKAVITIDMFMRHVLIIRVNTLM